MTRENFKKETVALNKDYTPYEERTLFKRNKERKIILRETPRKATIKARYTAQKRLPPNPYDPQTTLNE